MVRPSNFSLQYHEHVSHFTIHLATPLGLLTQAGFLIRMGIETRVSALVEAAKDRERKNDIANAADRLVSPTGMGRQYRIMGISGLRESRLGAETRWPFLDTQN